MRHELGLSVTRILSMRRLIIGFYFVLTGFALAPSELPDDQKGSMAMTAATLDQKLEHLAGTALRR